VIFLTALSDFFDNWLHMSLQVTMRSTPRAPWHAKTTPGCQESRVCVAFVSKNNTDELW